LIKIAEKQISPLSAAIVVPTLNAGLLWKECISALLATGTNVQDVYIVDSGSSDDTVEMAINAGFNVRQIELGSFNHGATRQLAVNDLENYDLVIFLTQDAILHDANSVRNIISPFDSPLVGAVCGRQLPRVKAGSIEEHARLFNYPETSSISSINDADVKGLKAAFLSNSFAAYRVSALLDVGGFPANAIFGEDMYVAARLLQAGYLVAYAAEACVYHSHGYSITQEFKRYFDMGVFHANEPWIRQALGGAEGAGIRFVISEYKYLLKHAVWRIPEGMLRTLFRYMGFRLGLSEKWMPLRLKRSLAMNNGYFRK
jgi:rhamnosyltransferase